MFKKHIVLILIILITLVGCGSNQEPKLSADAKNIIKKVSEKYGEKNPKIVQINTTKEETTQKTMYIVYLKGDFKKGEQKSQNLEFSMTGDGKKVWALTSDSWQENEVNLNGYELNKTGKEIKCLGTLVNDKEYQFSTYVQLGTKEMTFSSIIKLNFKGIIELNKENKRYEFKNPILEITPIGCQQYAKEKQVITNSEYSANYEFGVKANESFDQDMEIGIAKVLLDDKSIKVRSAKSANTCIKINSVNDLKSSKDNKANVTLDFYNSGNYFTCWYVIIVRCISDNEVVLSVN
jgi:hypothetical protein